MCDLCGLRPWTVLAVIDGRTYLACVDCAAAGEATP